MNPADKLPKVGRKNQALEREMMSLIAGEIQERDEALERLRQTRFFDTTNKSEFIQKPMTENTIGRWVMKSQDGQPIPLGETRRRDY